MRYIAKLLDENGATSVEYAVMIALILMAIIGAVSSFGGGTGGMWGGINDDLKTVDFIK
jgi:Flp pilus assembly pilin Flp